MLILDDYWKGNYHLKDGIKEDVHYKVVDDITWRFLYEIYGGTDMPRLSIQVPTSTDKYDHLVEINLRRFTTMTQPRVKYI